MPWTLEGTGEMLGVEAAPAEWREGDGTFSVKFGDLIDVEVKEQVAPDMTEPRRQGNCDAARLPGKMGAHPAERLLPMSGTLAVVATGRDAAGSEHLEPLGEKLFEVGDAPTLHQHVPMGAWRLALLALGPLGVDTQRRSAAEPALPGWRDLSLSSEGHLEVMPLGAVVGDHQPRSEIDIAVGLVAGGAET